jgi:hypothetical protein
LSSSSVTYGHDGARGGRGANPDHRDFTSA